MQIDPKKWEPKESMLGSLGFDVSWISRPIESGAP